MATESRVERIQVGGEGPTDLQGPVQGPVKTGKMGVFVVEQ